MTEIENDIQVEGGEIVNPSEVIYFLLIGVAILVAILFVSFIFRGRKKWAIVITTVLVIGFVGYYLYYPSLKVKTHTERYEQVMDYLAKKYPNKKFTISPKHYEEGYTVGEFMVNDIKIPQMGVTLSVDKEGQVTQTSTWSTQDYPTQQELWREIPFSYGGTYTLDKELAEITKLDEWINGELTAFALTIDNLPAIALFNYSNAGYGLLELQQGEQEEVVSIEMEGYLFIYIDDRYQGDKVTVELKNGEEYTANVDENKGRLIVRKL